MHIPEEYRKYVIEWNKKLIYQIEKGENPEMVKYLRAYPIDTDNAQLVILDGGI